VLQLNFKARTTSNLQWKIDRVMASARAGAQQGVEKIAADLRDDVAQTLSRIYDKATEIRTLTQGIITQPMGAGIRGTTGGLVGTTSGGRFNESGWRALYEIVAACPVITTRQSMGVRVGAGGLLAPKSVSLTGGNYVSAMACDTKTINYEAKFWYTRKDGTTLMANPFNGKYMESVEHGGVWNVRPRSDNKGNALFPQPGILARGIRKSVGPLRPFGDTIFKTRARHVAGFANFMKTYIQFIRTGGLSSSASAGATLV